MEKVTPENIATSEKTAMRMFFVSSHGLRPRPHRHTVSTTAGNSKPSTERHTAPTNSINSSRRGTADAIPTGKEKRRVIYKVILERAEISMTLLSIHNIINIFKDISGKYQNAENQIRQEFAALNKLIDIRKSFDLGEAFNTSSEEAKIFHREFARFRVY